MGVVRRGLAGALSGLGEGFASTGNAYLQHIFHGEDMDKENALLLARQRQEAIPRLGEFMGTHPELADAFEAFGQKNNMDLSPFHVSDQDRLAPLIHSINSAPDELHTPSVADLTAGVQNTGRPGLNTPVLSPTLAPGAPSPAPPAGIASPLDQGENVETPRPQSITDLIAARQAHLDALQAQRDITYKDLQAKSTAEATGKGLGDEAAASANFPALLSRDTTKAQVMGPIAATNAGLSKSAELDSEQTPEHIRGAAHLAGAVAGAKSDAEEPNAEKLAQIKANLALLQKQELQEWQEKHPKATADQLNMHANAAHALQLIDYNRQLLTAMDSQGMLGPLVGRGEELAAQKVKSADIFSNPAQASMANDYFSSMDLLGKLAAKVHGGTRAAASPQMAAQFRNIISASGDKANTEGQLNALERLMKIYNDNPNAPPMLDLSQYGFKPDTSGSGGLTPGLQRLGQRGGTP